MEGEQARRSLHLLSLFARKQLLDQGGKEGKPKQGMEASLGLGDGHKGFREEGLDHSPEKKRTR